MSQAPERLTQRVLDAFVSIAGDLNLEAVLRRIIESAIELTGARYGALGVVGEHHDTAADGSVYRLARFIPVGMDSAEVAAIDHWPRGEGLLGLLIDEQQPFRVENIAAHPASSGYPPGHPPMDSFLGVPVQVRGTTFGNLYLTDKTTGPVFTAEDEEAVTTLAAVAGVAIENARLYDQAQRRGAWLEASTEVLTRLLGGAEATEALGLIAERSAAMAAADFAAVISPGRAGVVATTATQVDPSRLRAAADADRHVQDFAAGVDTHVVTDERTEASAVLELAGMRSGLFMALRHAGEVRGVLVVGNRAGSTPTPPDVVSLLRTFGEQAALALTLGEARETAERLSVLEDRDRIARDLHDVVIQRLFASAMTLMGAVRRSTDPMVTDRIQATVDDLDETIRHIRSTIFALQTPPDPDAPTLRRRVLEVVDAAVPALGMTPGVEFEGTVDTSVTDVVAEHLLAVLGEALSNVARHAKAGRVTVRLEVRDERVYLVVTDDGVGISADVPRSGLRNLAERAAELGGSFEARRRAAGGTTLTWQVPAAGSAGLE